ncbi:MAG: phytanoyl-CoA dioxygenase family protein [Gaiellaceae bacterium]
MPRREFEERGFVVVRDALPPSLLACLVRAHDNIYCSERVAGRLADDGSLHLLGFLTLDDTFLELLDLPAVFPLVCDALGWNIYAYHSHLDTHPQETRDAPRRWRWHQDGGRQNVELETRPTRPRLSVKVGYFLTDVLTAESGAMLVIPGSHVRNTLPRPAAGDESFAEPDGAEAVLAPAGSAIVFDCRLWHARGANRSDIARKALFVAYTFRWIRPREDLWSPEYARLSPLKRQLLGAATDQLGYWLPGDGDVPLRAIREAPMMNIPRARCRRRSRHRGHELSHPEGLMGRGLYLATRRS